VKLTRLLLAVSALAASTSPAAAQQAQPAAAAEAKPAQSASEPAQAAAADLVAGAPVVDGKGQPVGTIESADGGGAVVTTGKARARLNLDAFYKNGRALVIGYTRAQFEELAGGKTGAQ
jgi:glucose/arabinose dehydrogenase